MNLRKYILLIIVLCAGLLTHRTFEVDSQEISQIQSCLTAQDFSYLHSTGIDSASDCFALTSTQTITAPILRHTNARRSSNNTNLAGKTAHTVREITRRQFSKSTDEPSFFQTTCTKSVDYLIRIGILVI